MTRQQQFFDFLSTQGFRPELHGPMVAFKSEGGTFVLYPDEEDTTYFQLVFPNFWNLESAEERARAVVAAGTATERTKSAKVFVQGDNTVAAIESFQPDFESFQAVFDRSMSALRSAVHTFGTTMREGTQPPSSSVEGILDRRSLGSRLN